MVIFTEKRECLMPDTHLSLFAHHAGHPACPAECTNPELIVSSALAVACFAPVTWSRFAHYLQGLNRIHLLFRSSGSICRKHVEIEGNIMVATMEHL
jgi:hypothetical protein